MTKSKVAQFNKNKNKKSNKSSQIRENQFKKPDELKDKWYVRFFKSFIALVVTILIYTFVIKILTQYGMVITQSAIEEKGLESDPVLILVFSVGLYSTIMAVFIAKVNVYKLIISLSNKSVEFLQRNLNHRKNKKDQAKNNKKVNDNSGRKSKK